MARLELESVSKTYGDFRAADDINLDIGEGEFLVLLGPSGCGKTTTLRMIAGFIDPSHGVIRVGGKDITRLPPWKRNTGLVFQNYALFPHLTVAQNVAFGLEMRKVPHADIGPRVKEALQMVRLDHLAERYPRQMSGGQQQRVALARALAFEPDILLLDEPLSNLDAKLRQEVRVEIRSLQKRLGITTVMVTHDQEEALTMADRLVVMNAGKACQIGRPIDLYDRPNSEFVASFVGRSSFLRGRFSGSRLISTGGIEIASERRLVGDAVMALRPERVSITPQPVDTAENCFPGTVELVSHMGSCIDIHVRLNDEDCVVAQVANSEGRSLPEIGTQVFLTWSASAPVFGGHLATD